MSKELEALEFICKILKEKGIDIKWLFKEQYNTIKQRLESIDNAKALECFDRILHCNDDDYTQGYFNHDVNIVKQALIKAQEQEKEIDRLENQCLDVLGDNIRLKNKSQEQEKVLEIIKEKLVNIVDLWQCTDLYTYNSLVKGTTANGTSRELTQKEYDLLKRWLNNA